MKFGVKDTIAYLVCIIVVCMISLFVCGGGEQVENNVLQQEEVRVSAPYQLKQLLFENKL